MNKIVLRVYTLTLTHSFISVYIQHHSVQYLSVFVRIPIAESHPFHPSSSKVEDFLPIFADDLHQLECFLRSLLLAPAGSSSHTPPDAAERLFSTFLELRSL